MATTISGSVESHDNDWTSAETATGRNVGFSLWRGVRGRCPRCGRGRLFCAFLIVALPDLRSEVPEDRVRNRDVEEEVRQQQVPDVVVAAEAVDTRPAVARAREVGKDYAFKRVDDEETNHRFGG